VANDSSGNAAVAIYDPSRLRTSDAVNNRPTRYYRRNWEKHESEAKKSLPQFTNWQATAVHADQKDGYNRLLMDAQPTWTQVSDCALLARFHGLSPIEAQGMVTRLFEAFSAENINGINNLHPAFATLLVVYSPLAWTPAALVQRLEEARKRASSAPAVRDRVTIPVCFATGFAPDLGDVAAGANLTVDQAVERFSSCIFHVAFLGFAPGFPYLLGLPPELATPRLARPRTHVAAGSVGIAGEQTGIYPAGTPGGWRIVGRTPLRLFDSKRVPMSLLLPGDQVRFEVIDEQRYRELSQW
jgi:inhibitor of KinA